MPSTALARRRCPPSRARPAAAGAAASRRGEGAIAFIVYLGLSLVLIGRATLHGGGVGSGTLGLGPDVQIFLWSLRWWPHAVGHGLDPLHSPVVWPPFGGAVLWSSTVPLLGLLATPLTLLLGAAGSWNVLVLLAPAATAWAAWLLCAESGAARLPALLGGALFGFGSFVMCEDIAHLQLSACPLLPLTAWTALRGMRGGWSRRRLAGASAAIVLAQFLICQELLVTLGLVTVIGFLLGRWLLGEERAALGHTAAGLAAGAVAGAVLVSPFVVEMLTHVPRSASGAVGYPTDLLNLAVPTARTALGGPWLTGISSRFPGNAAEQTGYLGLPLIVLILAWGRRERHRPLARWLLATLGVCLLLTLGSALTVDGARTVWLPWAAVAHLPFLRDALPARLMVYIWLGAAVITARWLSDVAVAAPVRAAAALLVVVSLVPAGWLYQPDPPPARSAAVLRELRGQRVLSLPLFDVGDRGLVVQERAGFRFGLIDSWLQLRPHRWAPDLPGTALTDRALARVRGRAARRFVTELRAAHITRLLLWEQPPGLLRALHLPVTRAAGVEIVRVP